MLRAINIKKLRKSGCPLAPTIAWVCPQVPRRVLLVALPATPALLPLLYILVIFIKPLSTHFKQNKYILWCLKASQHFLGVTFFISTLSKLFPSKLVRE